MTALGRNASAFVFGVCATLALPPFFYSFLLIPAFGGLFWLLSSAASLRRVFWEGWFWGWGFYISGLYWFCIALLTDPEKFAWALPFALLGVPGVLAIYSGVASWLAMRLRVGGIAGIFVFTTVWTLSEYARGHLFTGFPWNLPGYAFSASDASLQLAWLLGAYGLSWCAVWLGTVPLALMQGGKRAMYTAAVSYALLALGIGWGAWRLHAAPATDYVEGVKIRLVQANIAQHHKWEPERQMQGLKEHLRLTHAPGLDQVTHVIWPETALPFVLREDSPLIRLLGEALPEGALLISGGLRQHASGPIANSIFAMDHAGNVVGYYDKHKLVPFGEFLPLRGLIPPRWLLPVGLQDFSAGPGAQVVRWPGLPPLRPLICYEAIFPDLAAGRERRPAFLLNLTNDGWFGSSSGPYQHFEMARMRAVEEGIPLVRAANTGISAVTDGYGRIVEHLELGKQGVIDFMLQKSQLYDTTSNGGKNIFLLILIFIGMILIKNQYFTRQS